MRAKESGINWEVRRGLITPELAESAAGQATVFKTFPPSRVQGYTPVSLRNKKDAPQVLKVDLADLTSEDSNIFSALVEVSQIVQQICEEIVPQPTPQRPACFLNFYRPGISTGDHVDSYAPATVSVGLRGNALAYIRDPLSQEWLPPLALGATDALCFDNTDPSQAPLHRVVCDSRLPRIALVNASK